MAQEELGRALAEAARLQFTAIEAAASVALSHPPDCACVVCRAADGDVDAIGEIMRSLRGK